MAVLANQEVANPATPLDAPEVWFLHGIFGSGRNWRSFTRQLSRRRPDLRYRVIDLRHHGDSHGFPPPHTLEACAQDLIALADSLGTYPCIVAGHSFGGKVAMTLGQMTPAWLHQVWVLDTTPGTSESLDDNEEIAKLFRLLGTIAMPVTSHESLKETLRGLGFSEALSTWMTTNLEHGPEGGLVWRFDLEGLRRLMDAYIATDSWPFLMDPPIPDVRFVRAGRNRSWTPEAIAKLGASKATVSTMTHAGHWLHADDPTTLLALFEQGLSRSCVVRDAG